MWVLAGIVVIAGGFLLRFNPLLVIIASALVTGLAAGLDPVKILATFGHAFNETRYVTAIYMVLPVIGLLERRGLQARARALPEDLESLEQPILLGLRPDGRPEDVPPMLAALAALLARTGKEEGQHLPGLALRRVLELAALGDDAGARALLAAIAAHFPVPPAFALLWPGELP